jgi:hypothetical protein
MHRSGYLLLALLLTLDSETLFAQGPAFGVLADLMRVQPGRSRRVSSAAPTADSNRDNKWIPPGETFVMADIEGPATITHIWLTFSEARPNWLSREGSANPSEIVLRMYWDGAEQPAVEAPLGDFFGAGFGLRREIRSAPVQVESGDGYNCFWPMPFHKRGKITVTNESEKRLSAFYYHIDYVQQDSLPPDTAYFCAQYRQEFPERLGGDYLVADITGRGHYVGTVMSARSRSPEWFGEGDDKFYIDGEQRPALWGTGTEDYFLCAWGMNECSFPCFGCTFMDGGAVDLGVRYTLYRWHIADPIRFTKSLRFEIEHKGWMSADETESGKIEGHVEREDDVATVAFWYQIGQPKRFTELPSANERVFPNLDVMVEGKTLLETARYSPGHIQLQKGYEWTGEGQIFLKPEQVIAAGLHRPSRSEGWGTDAAGGEQSAAGSAHALSGAGETRPTSGEARFLEFDLSVERKELRGLVLRLTHSYDYGRWQVCLDGENVGGPRDLYAEQIEVHDHYLGSYELEPGKHTIRLECTGRNPLSGGNYLGVDSVRLRERWHKKRPALR